MKKAMAIALLAAALYPQLSQASAGCFSGETDGSQWITQTIQLDPPVLIDYNSSRWEDTKSFQFNFGHTKIENPRSFSLQAKLATPTTENQSVDGRLESSPGRVLGGVVSAGRNKLYANLNHDIYFDKLKTGNIHLGLGRTGSNEKLEITEITAKFCGVVISNGDSITVDAATYNLGAANGEALVHHIDADTTYRVSVSGSATDGMGHTMPSVSVNYIDSRKKENVTQQLATGGEFYIHSDGKISLFYATESNNSTGGHTVNLSRVNID